MKELNDYVAIYKEQLDKGDIQKAYTGLVKFTQNLKTHLSKGILNNYIYGNIFQGYMDFTYFYFFNDFLRENKLRFGVVLNHEKCRFELWLLGQNAEIQKKYWGILKTTKWNKDQQAMPKYSVLEVVLIENPNFNELDTLNQEIEKGIVGFTKEIINYLEKQANF